mmetsp:Transcript_39592/g.104929  ORF Transcript_39592/g.104929 Transcript_39592/m.104929 type:complete len:262 (+) Transcript_39592:378-1163(+)
MTQQTLNRKYSARSQLRPQAECTGSVEKTANSEVGSQAAFPTMLWRHPWQTESPKTSVTSPFTPWSILPASGQIQRSWEASSRSTPMVSGLVREMQPRARAPSARREQTQSLARVRHSISPSMPPASTSLQSSSDANGEHSVSMLEQQASEIGVSRPTSSQSKVKKEGEPDAARPSSDAIEASNASLLAVRSKAPWHSLAPKSVSLQMSGTFHRVSAITQCLRPSAWLISLWRLDAHDTDCAPIAAVQVSNDSTERLLSRP